MSHRNAQTKVCGKGTSVCLLPGDNVVLITERVWLRPRHQSAAVLSGRSTPLTFYWVSCIHHGFPSVPALLLNAAAGTRKDSRVYCYSNGWAILSSESTQTISKSSVTNI